MGAMNDLQTACAAQPSEDTVAAALRAADMFRRTAVLVRPERERDDDEQWATVTQPATMDADQLRRDLIASQCQAPRIPRKRSPVLSADSPDGTSRQGRDIPRPTEPVDVIDESREYSRLWWFVMIVLFAISCAFALAGCGGGGDDQQQQGGTATVQPVECAAAGCAK